MPYYFKVKLTPNQMLEYASLKGQTYAYVGEDAKTLVPTAKYATKLFTDLFEYNSGVFEMIKENYPNVEIIEIK